MLFPKQHIARFLGLPSLYDCLRRFLNFVLPFFSFSLFIMFISWPTLFARTWEKHTHYYTEGSNHKSFFGVYGTCGLASKMHQCLTSHKLLLCQLHSSQELPIPEFAETNKPKHIGQRMRTCLKAAKDFRVYLLHLLLVLVPLLFLLLLLLLLILILILIIIIIIVITPPPPPPAAAAPPPSPAPPSAIINHHNHHQQQSLIFINHHQSSSIIINHQSSPIIINHH